VAPIVAESTTATTEPVEEEPEDELLAVDAGMVWSVAAAENVGADTTSIKIAHTPRSFSINTEQVESEPQTSQEEPVMTSQDDGLTIQHDDGSAVVRWR
jgi:hypothetical protein